MTDRRTSGDGPDFSEVKTYVNRGNTPDNGGYNRLLRYKTLVGVGKVTAAEQSPNYRVNYRDEGCITGEQCLMMPLGYPPGETPL